MVYLSIFKPKHVGKWVMGENKNNDSFHEGKDKKGEDEVNNVTFWAVWLLLWG